MANKSSFIIVVLLLTMLVAGVDTRLTENSTLSVVQQGSISAVGGELTYINLNLTVPSTTDYQKSTVNAPVKNIGANSIVNLVNSKPENPFNYQVTSSVLVNARHITYLPATYQLSHEDMLYTSPTQRIQSDDAEIRKVALGITANSSDDFERISKIALWVNQHMTYDLSLTGSYKDAKWVLENQRGVCEEYATLFVALTRSIGIPARIVNGLAYDDNQNQWVGHAWAEAYIGAWVPVDPTWTPPEVGYLDAMHLEFSKTLDNETLDNFWAYTSQNAKLEWSEENATTIADVTLLSSTEGARNSGYDVEEVASTVGFGMKTLVFTVVQSDEYRVVELNMSHCDLLNVMNGDRYIILEPHKPQVVSWVLTPVSGLQSNYEYECEFIIDSEYLAEKNYTVTILPQVSSINFKGLVEKNELGLGENQTVYVDIGTARSYSGTLYLTSDDSFYSQPITRSGRYSFSIKPAKVGLNKVYLATSFGGVQELNFEVDESTDLHVDVNSPQFVPLGSQGDVYVNLTSNKTDENVRVVVSAGGYKEMTQLSLTGNKTLEFSMLFNDSSTQNVTVNAESGGFTSQVVEPVTVYEIPTVNFTSRLSYLQNGSVQTGLVFSGIETAKNVTVTVDGLNVPLAPEGVASVVLATGIHSVRVEYSDIGGTQYSYNSQLEIPTESSILVNESAIEGYISNPLIFLPAMLCLGLALIILIALVALKKAHKSQQQ